MTGAEDETPDLSTSRASQNCAYSQQQGSPCLCPKDSGIIIRETLLWKFPVYDLTGQVLSRAVSSPCMAFSETSASTISPPLWAQWGVAQHTCRLIHPCPSMTLPELSDHAHSIGLVLIKLPQSYMQITSMNWVLAPLQTC